MRINRGIRQQLLAASFGVSLLQLIALGAVGSVLVSAAAGDVRAQQTLNTEAIGRIAQAITVRIEGATQGSGVLVKREGNRYTVLTAWHVVSGQRLGEELAIYTPDGRSHVLEPGSIKRVGQVDLAVLTFSSMSTYQLARIGDIKNVNSGSSVFVAGFPLSTSSVPIRLMRFLDGQVIAKAQVAIPNGYQLLYTNQTLPGMSGGAVLNGKGQLVGIHASAERADQMSERSGKAVATGTNQGVPIGYYTQAMSSARSSAPPLAANATTRSADDYLAQAKQPEGVKDKAQEMIQLASQALIFTRNAQAYFNRGKAKSQLGDSQGAIADLNESVKIDPEFSEAWMALGLEKYSAGDIIGGCADIYRSAVLGNSNAAGKYLTLCSRDILLDPIALVIPQAVL
jgi:S1-C subfamily serine protease